MRRDVRWWQEATTGLPKLSLGARVNQTLVVNCIYIVMLAMVVELVVELAK